MASLTNCHRLGGLNNRNLFSYSSGGLRSEIRAQAGPASSETLGQNSCLFRSGNCPQISLHLTGLRLTRASQRVAGHVAVTDHPLPRPYKDACDCIWIYLDNPR